MTAKQLTFTKPDATPSDRLIATVEVTGAVPGAAPTLVGDGFACLHLAKVSAVVVAEAAHAAGRFAVLTPWLYVPVTKHPAGGFATKAWVKGAPTQPIALDATGEVSVKQAFDCEIAERFFLQVVPDAGVGVGWVTADVYEGVLRSEAQVVSAGMTREDLISALLAVFKNSIPIKVTSSAWERVERAAANLPQTTHTPYFAASGRILLHGIIGRVTTIIEDLDNNAKLLSNPTVGADVDLCAAANIRNDAVGTWFTITGAVADALVETPSGAAPFQANPVLIAAGTIDLDCSANRTGQTEWIALWTPVDLGATLTAI